MRKIVVAAILAAVAVMATQVASASANTITGTCKIHGKAKFFEPGSGGATAEKLKAQEKQLEYRFTSDTGGAEGTFCVEAGTTGKKTATANVNGEGKISCETGKSTAPRGKGTLTIGTTNYPFELAFTAAAGTVSLEVWNEGSGALAPEATGAANFAASEHEKAATCLEKGVFELEFEASVTGTV